MGSRRGFSLIELVVVLTLLSVVLAIGAPRLADFTRGLRLDQSARQVKAYLEYARAVAIGEGRAVRVRAEPGWRALELLVERRRGSGRFEPAGVPGGGYRLAASIRIGEVRMNARRAADRSPVLVEITPLYVPDEVEFELIDDRGGRRRVIQRAGGGEVVIDG